MKYVFELSINHNLYKGAYSGLCCGNVYRDKGEKDSIKDRYDLGNKIFPVIHGHSYIVEIDTDNDKIEPIFEKYFDEYQGATILTDDNPLSKIFPDKLIIWKENPTAEVMSKKWYEHFKENHVLSVTVEETAKNKVKYSNKGYEISTHIELPISREEDNGSIKGYNFSFTFIIKAKDLNKEGMVIDFKAFKKAIHDVMDQYDHSIILSGKIDNSPSKKLLNAYLKNFKENKIDAERTRVFKWGEAPTDYKMSVYFAREIYFNMISKRDNLDNIEVTCIVNRGIVPDRYRIISRNIEDKIFYKQYFDTFKTSSSSFTVKNNGGITTLKSSIENSKEDESLTYSNL